MSVPDLDPGSAAVAETVEAFVRVDNAHRHIRNRAARDHGFTHTELTAILLIAETPDLTPRRLGDEIMMTTGAVSALIDRLVSAGHVERIPNPKDRRSVLVTLTFRGEEIMTLITARYAQAMAEVLSEFSDRTRETVLNFLTRSAAIVDDVAFRQP